MSDPHVRELGHVWDVDSRKVTVGVDYDTCVIAGLRLDRAQAEEFAQLFVAACWAAGRYGIEFEQELEARE